MAARNEAKKYEGTSSLPRIDSSFTQTRRNVRKPLGNIGSKVLLPSLDPIQNMNAIYDVKRFCKLLCEWYDVWRAWQKELLLCSLSEKCSVNILTLLSTILEPVFHRDFLSRLRDTCRNAGPKTASLTKDTKNENPDCTSGEQEDLGEKKDDKCEGNIIDDGKCGRSDGISRNFPHKNTRKLKVHVKSTREKCQKKRIRSPYTSVLKKQTTKQEECLALDDLFPLVDMIKDSLSNEKVYCSNNFVKLRSKNHSLAFERGSCHVHTSNTYDPGASDSRFFSSSRCSHLSNMKADITKSNLQYHHGELNQKCFKHKRWWPPSSVKSLVPADSLRLWNHFTKQLDEVNKRMEKWDDHEKVSCVSEVIKVSEPPQIKFFAQCLIQRLKNHTDIDILPDQTLLRVFAKLDAKTLCLLSQVSKRWRYLAEDDDLWKRKCLQLGSSNGVSNLVNLIEASAEGRTVDWKQAYQEVYQLLESLRQKRCQAEIEFQSESLSTTSESQLEKEDSENEAYSDIQPLTATEISTEIHVEYLDLTPASDEKLVCESPESAYESNNGDKESIGGDISLLEDTLSELTNEMPYYDGRNEYAYDIRTNKVQPVNEMEAHHNDQHQMVTVNVEDVKSVKRVRKLQGHLDGVYTVQFDAKRCLTCSADRLLRMWDVRSGRVIRTLSGHLGGVRCAQFDREKILSGSWDTTIMVWDIVKFTRIRVLYGHQGCVSCLSFNTNYIASGSHDMTARVWDVGTWECLHVLEGHSGEITCLYLSGVVLLTGSTDKTIKVWNVENGECIKSLVGHNTAVLSLQACRALVISGSRGGKIMFWDVQLGSPVAMIHAHDGPCNCLHVWGNHFLSGGGDALVKQWDIGTMTCLRTLQGHKGPVQSVKMSWSKIISSSEDGTVRIWDLEAPMHKFGQQYDEYENSLLPFDTVEQEEEEF